MDVRGLSKETIEALEAPMGELTFGSVVERLDAVFNKAWSFRFDGPDLIEAPMRVPKYPQAKNPRAFVVKNTAQWQCKCSIEVMGPEVFQEIAREYSVLVPSQEGAYEAARDLSFIYAAYHGLGVGKRSRDLALPESKNVRLQPGGDSDILSETLREFATLKTKLGLATNAELDPYVLEWSHGEMESYRSINKTNIRAFTDFLRDKLTADVRQPPPA